MKMSPQQAQELMRQINRDAAAAGVSPKEFLRRLVAGQHVVGGLGAGEIPSGPTYISAEGGGVWNNIADAGEPQDDFEELAAQHSRLLEQAGGDDLARDVLLRDWHHSNLAEQAKTNFTSNPVTAKNSLLGGTTTLQAGDQPFEVARWTGEDLEARNVIVSIGQAQQLATNLASAIHAPIQARPYAIVQWATRGVLFTAFVDALQGTQFSIGASFVSLQMAMQPLTAYPLNVPVPVPLLLTGALSFGIIERGPRLTYTWYSDTFATDSPTIPIPPFAKEFTFYCDNTAATLDLVMGDIGTVTISTAKGLSGDAALAKTIQLPGNAVFLNPQNIVGAPQHVAIVFGLSL